MPKSAAVEHFTLPNGIKVVYRKVNSTRLVHCGFVMDAGSRDEAPNQVGIAHFTEHMVFKGTLKRKAWHILNRLDSVGGDLNAYTTKEKTSYYASVTKDHFARAVELLFDISRNATFPAHELEKEKGVILEEIEMYNDSPEDMILEALDRITFPDHPLGNPILGLKEQIPAFTMQDFIRFRDEQYTPARMAFSVVGNFNVKSIEAMIKTFLEPLQASPQAQPLQRSQPKPFDRQELSEKKTYQQANFVIAGNAYPYGHKYYFALLALNYLLGGPAMNSRLSMTLREKHGLTYNVYSFYNPFVDCGQWGIYVGCDTKQLPKVRKLIEKELLLMCSETFTPAKLLALKRQFIGHITLNNESLPSQMISYAKDYLDFNRLYLLDDVIAEIQALTPEMLSQTANEIMHPDRLSSLLFEPEED